jgi:hypothetical protein
MPLTSPRTYASFERHPSLDECNRTHHQQKQELSDLAASGLVGWMTLGSRRLLNSADLDTQKLEKSRIVAPEVQRKATPADQWIS